MQFKIEKIEKLTLEAAHNLRVDLVTQKWMNNEHSSFSIFERQWIDNFGLPNLLFLVKDLPQLKGEKKKEK